MNREDQSNINLGIAKLRDECSQLKIGFRTQITSTQNTILEAIDALSKSTDQTKTTVDTSIVELSKMLLEVQTEVDDAQLQHRILRQLVFEDMNSRANQIPKASQDTYNWTVEDGPLNKGDKRGLAWTLFLEWLRAGDKILHVSGNPGSGKSTLMKFLSQNERTKEELKVWATTKSLVFCVFYFWNPGSMAQRSLTGLYRSLLFQTLSQCPDLTEQIFPVQFRKMKTFTGDTMVERIQDFDDTHIEEAFKLLLSRATPDKYRLCFFIDGLDECEGSMLEHEQLAKMLQSWVISGAVKLCVSSRPYHEFTRTLALPRDRKIQLHKLNESDIRAYCLDRLGNDIDAQKRGEICQRLVENVVGLAQGVFLWVHLVIDILVVGFRQDDPDSVLLARLESLPSDLDKLYTKLREPIEKDRIQKTRSGRMLLMAANNPSRSSLTAMAFSWLEGQEGDQGGLNNPDFPPKSGLDPYCETEISKRLDHVTKQVNGLARGFLEIVTRPFALEGQTESFFRPRVEFSHRTARDYLLHNKDRNHAMLNSFPDFEPSNVYTRILLAETIYGWHSRSRYRDIHVFTAFDRPFCQNVDPDLVSKFELAVSELEPASILSIGMGGPVILRTAQPAQMSFTAYAAWCGLDRFVFRELARDIRQLDERFVGCSVLCAAVAAENYNLALGLLEMGRGMDHLCETSSHKYGDWKKVTLVPAFVIALARIFSTSPIDGRLRWPEELLKLAKGLLKSILSRNISMWATISGFHASGRGVPDKFAIPPTSEPEIRVRLGIAETIKLVESSTRRMGGESSEPQNVNTTGDGPGDDQRISELLRLKEWFEEPSVEPKHAKYVVRKEMYVESVEWSSETQKLVEVTGWFRVY